MSGYDSTLFKRKRMPRWNISFSKRNVQTLLSILVIVPVGFASKFYSGPAEDWVRNSLSGAFYVIFWCLLLFFFCHRLKPATIALMVLLITCSLEFLQLWRPTPLEYLRKTFIGRAVLGTTFTWSDFPYYGLGAVIGWIWLSMLSRKSDLSFKRLPIDIR